MSDVDYGINIDLNAGGVVEMIKDITKGFAGLSDVVSVTTDEIDELSKLSSKITYFEKMTHSAEEYGKKVDIQRKKVEKLNKELANTKLTDKQRENKNGQLERANLLMEKKTQKQAKYNKSLKETGDYLRRAGVNTDNLADEQSRLNREVQQTTRKLAKQKKALYGIKNTFKGIKGIGKGVADITKNIAIAGVGGAVAGGGILKGFIDTAAEKEKYLSILKTLEGGDKELAQQNFDWISDFATTTPYQLNKVTEAFVKLRAYGIDPIDGDALRTYGDTASAMGKDINQVVEAVADAITGENERLKELGIKASTKGNKITYAYTDQSGEQRSKSVDKNNRAMIKSTLEAIWNEKYAGAMDDMSGTWQGMMSNLSDQWTRFQSMVMDAGAFDWMKTQLSDLLLEIEWLTMDGELQEWAEELSKKIIAVAIDIKNAAVSIWEFAQKVAAIANKVASFAGGWDNLMILLVSIKAIVMAGGLISGLGSIATGITAIGVAAGIATAPLWATIAVIGGLAAAWYFWEDIMSWLETSFPSVHDFFAFTIPDIIDTAVEAFFFFNPVADLVRSVFKRITTDGLSWKSVFGGIMDWFDAKIAGLRKALAWVKESISSIKTAGAEISQKAQDNNMGLVASAGQYFGEMKFGGGRATGGDVSSGKFYEVNELGIPELFETRGKQFLMPLTDGKVIPFKQPKNTIPSLRAEQSQQQASATGRLDIHIDSPVPAKVKRLESEGMEINVHTGPMGLFA